MRMDEEVDGHGMRVLASLERGAWKVILYFAFLGNLHGLSRRPGSGDGGHTPLILAILGSALAILAWSMAPRAGKD